MSGYGREQGAEALENYTQYKTVWANLGSDAHANRSE
jgi:aldehyde dehydrogenase (NAD+)